MAKKKAKSKTREKESDEKFTLIDLVSNSEVRYFKIILNLSREGLLEQLEEEKQLMEQGEPITPSFTQEEFDKLMEA